MVNYSGLDDTDHFGVVVNERILKDYRRHYREYQVCCELIMFTKERWEGFEHINSAQAYYTIKMCLREAQKSFALAQILRVRLPDFICGDDHKEFSLDVPQLR